MVSHSTSGIDLSNISAPKQTDTAKQPPTCLRDLGPPEYVLEGRVRFCKLFREDPLRLREYIAFSILRNPTFDSEELNRLPFNLYGAKVAGICQLFGCPGLQEVAARASAEFRPPRASRVPQMLQGGEKMRRSVVQPKSLETTGASNSHNPPFQASSGKLQAPRLEGDQSSSFPIAASLPFRKMKYWREAHLAPKCITVGTQTQLWPAAVAGDETSRPAAPP